MKDPTDLKDMEGVYIVPCSCWTPYLGETDRSIKQTIHEYAVDIRHMRMHSSTFMELIAKRDHFHHHKFKEALEVEMKPISTLRWNNNNFWVSAISC